MHIYKTLNGEVFDLDKLTDKERKIYKELKSYYDSNQEWTAFSNLWFAKIRRAFKDEKPSVVVQTPIYKICQDLDSRLGLKQGYTREPDYRDLLIDIIGSHFKSQSEFSKTVGIDPGYLSSVLAKRKHLSVEKLEQILSKTNYQIAFIERFESEGRGEKSKELNMSEVCA
jgi:hypothetical protein